MKNFEVKNAATIIVLRGSNENSKVLMGQRGEGASFMPNKFVFPGGAVDKGDSGIIPDDKINKACRKLSKWWTLEEIFCGNL